MLYSIPNYRFSHPEKLHISGNKCIFDNNDIII